ncbi:MAG: hypothetical protein ACYDH5_13575 [Acidimicrobiales bacterium]
MKRLSGGSRQEYLELHRRNRGYRGLTHPAEIAAVLLIASGTITTALAFLWASLARSVGAIVAVGVLMPAITRRKARNWEAAERENLRVANSGS